MTEAAEDKKRSWSLRVRMVRGCYRSVPREATPLPVQSCAHQNSETAEGTEEQALSHKLEEACSEIHSRLEVSGDCVVVSRGGV